jgi:hypothetical protein
MFGKSVFCALALGGSLIVPATSFAQSALGTPPAGSAGAGSAGVSGIPIGPGSAGGTNNSVYDPSGIGNAAKVPPIRAPVSTPKAPTSPSAVPLTTNVSPGPGQAATRGPRRAMSRSARSSAARAAVSARDKLLDRKLTSICRGC